MPYTESMSTEQQFITQWWWNTYRKLRTRADAIEHRTGVHVDIEKEGRNQYAFRIKVNNGESVSFAYSDADAMGFMHGLERGLVIGMERAQSDKMTEHPAS